MQRERILQTKKEREILPPPPSGLTGNIKSVNDERPPFSSVPQHSTAINEVDYTETFLNTDTGRDGERE